jgi:hypothetical protein
LSVLFAISISTANLSFRLLCGDENDFTSKYFIWKTLAETVTGPVLN